jgi:hypothetical protein
MIKIKNFTPELGETGKSIKYSFNFGTDDIGNDLRWKILIYPKSDCENDKDYLTIAFRQIHKIACKVLFKFSIVDGSGSYFAVGGDYLQRDVLFNKKNNLLKDDTLTLSVELKFLK